MIKAVVFDLDGTLLNTIQDLANASNYALEQLGDPTFTTEEYKHLVGDGRRNLILSTTPGFAPEGGEVYPSLDALLAAAPADAFVIGGESVYRALLDRCGTAYVTKILAQYPADRYFPDLDADPRWESVEESELLEENGVRFRYVTYQRRQEA